MPYEVGTEK